MKIAQIFGNGMVLQREKPIPIWGTGTDGEEICISFQGEAYQTTVKDGEWFVYMKPSGIARNEEMVILSDLAGLDAGNAVKGTQIVLTDISVGDVYLAGGQSNMEYWMLYESHYNEEVDLCENADIRFWDSPKVSHPLFLEKYDYKESGFWRACDKENLKYYSALAYYFAKDIQQTEQIPIGIIGCNWGGTRAASWMSHEALSRHGQVWLDEYALDLKKLGNIDAYIENYIADPMNDSTDLMRDEFNAAFLPGLSYEEQQEYMKNNPVQPLILGPCHHYRPSGLYENMLVKIAPYGLKGVLYYQGESDEAHGDIYGEVLQDLMQNWRDIWKDKELPFFIVQLAPYGKWLWYGGENYPVLRESQERAVKSDGRAYLVSSSDVGAKYDIHPKSKKELGYRAALLARKYLYGENLTGDAPKLTEARVDEEKLVLTFENAKQLQLEGEYLAAVKARGEVETDLQNCKAVVDGNRVILTGKNWDMYDEVILAYEAYYCVNLYNEEAVPAVPSKIMIKK